MWRARNFDNTDWRSVRVARYVSCRYAATSEFCREAGLCVLRGWMPLPRGCRRRDRSPWVSASRVASVAAALLSLAGASASAQTLTESFAYAYNNNPQLLAQRANLRATDEGVPQALANWRPTVTFTGSAGREDGFSHTPSAAFSRNVHSVFVPRSIDLTITQPIYRGGRTEAATRQAINT